MRITPEELHERAVARLRSLGLDADFISDDSGQTSQEEHDKWLVTASSKHIRQWASYMRPINTDETDNRGGH